MICLGLFESISDPFRPLRAAHIPNPPALPGKGSRRSDLGEGVIANDIGAYGQSTSHEPGFPGVEDSY
jgi:hypothetical protein